MRQSGRIFIIIAMAVLTACASPAARRLASTDQTGTAGLAAERILIATTRRPANEGRELFSGERSATVNHAAVTVTIPPVHKSGVLERPRRGDPQPDKHFAIRDPAHLESEAAFVEAVDAAIDASGGNRDVLVFVHGYNSGFSDSVLRFSQFAHDAGFDGATVLFSWASRGSAVEYLYDRESATIARDGLERTLRALTGSKAKRIHVMAHSMGNWVAMESLRQLQIGGNPTLDGRMGEVVLASPDIDIDVFKSQMRRLGQPEKPYNLLISRDDRALNLSQRLAGNRPRLGNYADDADLVGLGIVVYDLTAVAAGGSMKHGKFSDAPEIVRILGTRLNAGHQLAADEVRFSDRLGNLTRNIGEVVVSTGDVVIHAPTTVLTQPGEFIAAPVRVLGGSVDGGCKDCTTQTAPGR